MSGKYKQQQLIFGGGMLPLDSSLEEFKLEEQLEELDFEERFVDTRRPSAYVTAFEEMIGTVLTNEADLLSDEELTILSTFSTLHYNSRYCLIKLLLRKANQWHPVSALKAYEKEVTAEGLKIAIEDLCQANVGNQHRSVKTEDIEIQSKVQLTVKAEDIIADLSMTVGEDVKPSITEIDPTSRYSTALESIWSNRAGPSSQDPIYAVLQTDPAVANLSFFCEGESVMSTREILGRLNKGHLVSLAKEMKCKHKSSAKKEDIIRSLERQASSQQVLNFATPSIKGKGKARDDGSVQTQIVVPKRVRTQEQRLRELALKYLGSCVRVNHDLYKLARRLHLICFRSTEHPTDLLQPALLSIFKKWNYPQYISKRTPDVWISREELLEYEQALELNALLDEILDEQNELVPKRTTKMPSVGLGRTSFVTPARGGDRSLTTPLKTPGSIGSRQSATPVLGWGDNASVFDEPLHEEESMKVTRHRIMKQHFFEWIQPRWRDYVARDSELGVRPRDIGLERFDAGYVFTRMVYKASQSFGPLKEFELELHTLDDLLRQRFWCRGKRGKWHTRRAILFKHMIGSEKDLEKKESLQWRCLEGIQAALLDNDTGLVYRPGLVLRLKAMENTLKVPLRNRSQCEGVLEKPPKIPVKAARADPLKLNKLGREKENTLDVRKMLGATTAADDVHKETKAVKRTGKSIWQGRGGEIVNVETRALEDYEDKGYIGFHCETTLLKTLFGLLFWDIIYADVPGAFDTPYQICPLDLFHDSFYRARKDKIEKRSKELQQGKAAEILERHDDELRARACLNVAVKWELCTKEVLLEIVACFSGETLAMICQIFCEDYEGRCSGGPDLFVWNAKERKCKFVEVKGPGDSPQENQKLWFDSLHRAGADIEICLVVDINTPKGAKDGGKRKRGSSSGRRKSAPKKVEDLESEQEDYDHLDGGHEEEEEIIRDALRNKKRRTSAPADTLARAS
ncbi:VRR-NUC domain-containing protein [Crepidotus variabilis]|uniref:Fanconi-associated nuclease n=1 Tax=Crepidotus variabilis TaxID=179855 RepID=A0A9P6EQ04_9AGAR|nr:VRR-NUC domain-containing protein [Crepidotus variabilis]